MQSAVLLFESDAFAAAPGERLRAQGLPAESVISQDFGCASGEEHPG